MAAAYREGRARTSIAWEHFEIKDKERGVATCNHCHDPFSYRTSVSNLMKHLKGKHGYSIVKGESEEGVEGESDMENDEKSEPKPKLKNEAWEYFEMKDPDNKIATCSLCLDQFSFGDTLQILYQHLKEKHAIDFGKGSDEGDFKNDDDGDDDKDGMSLQQLDRSGRSKSSMAWDYFEVKDEDRKVALCNMCGALCSYRTSVSNLMKHVRRKHNIGKGSDEEDDSHVIVNEDDGPSKYESPMSSTKYESPMSRSQRSIVWLYFKCVDPHTKLSQCLICKKMLSHSTTLTNLKKHLSRKHPNVKIPARDDGRKRILLSSGGELYEVEAGTKLETDDENDEQNDTVEMDTVYLDDFDALEDDQPLKNLKSSKNKNKRVRNTSCSSSSEEEITFINRYKKKQSDSFDHFGKYLASVLRRLPEESSRQLQADFVKQILAVETNTEAQEFIPEDVVK